MNTKKNLQAIVLAFFVICVPAVHAQMSAHYIDVGQGDAILLEFPKAAVLIDAGGEDTSDLILRNHLLAYLSNFFQRRQDLSNTIHTVIISHPHIDHTRRLSDVVKKFTVRFLIDGGDVSGSGIGPLKDARQFVSTHGGRYLPIKDADLGVANFNVFAFFALRAADPDVGLRLLSGSRGCANANNNSLVLLVGYKTKRFLFGGDAEAELDENCDDEISTLIDRYQSSHFLNANVYKVSFHGSPNGTTEEWMQAINPEISVISAGQLDAAHRVPGRFHAWQFGHPRESAVRIIAGTTRGTRPTETVTMMRSAKRQILSGSMSRAVYCTCWDGDVVIKTDGGPLQVDTSR